MKAAREHWRTLQPQWERARLVFIDETGLNTKMARLYGRSLRNQRCVAAVPHGHWQTSTFIAALRCDGLAAPFLIEGAVNAEVFTAYLRQVLCPELRKNDLVILDNLSTHKKNDDWLTAHPNVTFHFTPTSASWLNQVEIWFGIFSRKALAGASFASIAQLVQAIRDFTEAYNRNAAPFVWRKREVKGAQLRNTIVNLRN